MNEAVIVSTTRRSDDTAILMKCNDLVLVNPNACGKLGP
jgi:hypothetical protein